MVGCACMVHQRKYHNDPNYNLLPVVVALKIQLQAYELFLKKNQIFLLKGKCTLSTQHLIFMMRLLPEIMFEGSDSEGKYC